MNFLDKTGLAHFWSKIKSYIENKKYISSDNGSVSNIISITYEEYKRLEELGKLDPNTEYLVEDAQSSLNNLEELVHSIILESDKKKYPVGSIEFNVSGTNPASYLGFGTWELWGAGKVPIGVDTSDSTINKADLSVGSKTVKYKPAGTNKGTAVTLNAVSLSHSGGAVGNHKLTTTEIPAHNHSINWNTFYPEESAVFMNAQYAGTGGNWVGDRQFAIAAANHVNDLKYPQVLKSSVIMNLPTIADTGSSNNHNHPFTQPSAHSFTPTTKSITQPTFTGTEADINVQQPSISCYMWKRIA